jgi:hypothetical protein
MGSSGVLVVVSESCGRDTQCPTAHSRFVIRPVRTDTDRDTPWDTHTPARAQAKPGRAARPARGGGHGRPGRRVKDTVRCQTAKESPNASQV